MHPAFSVIFLTTLIGTGQGLFVALYAAEVLAAVGLLPVQERGVYAVGSLVVALFLVGGLIASFFHLGHPERAWRSAARWRTSWLSREVIVLPITIAAALTYGAVHHFGWNLGNFSRVSPVGGDLSLIVGAFGMLATFTLFVSTGMIYACIKFLQEWASPLTVINYTLLGLASGFIFASAYVAYVAPALLAFCAIAAIWLVLLGLITRSASLIRNARIKSKSSLQTAIGVRHTRISQTTQGFMGGSFNTREFFHGAPGWMFRSIKWIFLALAFVVPLVLLSFGLKERSTTLLVQAFIVHYLGLIAERWFFFAQANHPQNLYYQAID